MISYIVIVASLVLAAAYVLAWLIRPGFRQDIERPKHWFQNELRRYDQRFEGDQKDTRANGR